MLFNTIDFVIFFILVVAAVAIYKNRIFQHFFLLIASFFFFYYSSNYLISLLIASTLLDYYVGKSIWKSKSIQKKKALLVTSLVGNLGLLGFFKYANFGIEQFNSLSSNFGIDSIPMLDIVLPIGISFYTFQSISYTVDIYRNKITPCNSLKEFALFVAFFPQLVAGPIVRASEFLPQLRQKIDNLDFHKNLKQIVIHNTNFKTGVIIMTIGFLKKMFFADNISPLVYDIFTDPIGLESFTIILGSVAFYFQLYGDFSGYTDIAIGAALILGFKLPINFNHPFFARSPADFFRRWHITLFTWFRDYLYIPLGGDRKGRVRTYLNLWLVMLIIGLWHGASWNFVIWGFMIGTFFAIHRMITNGFPSLKSNSFFKSKIGIGVSIFITQYLIIFSAPAFRVQDFEGMMYSLQKFVFLDFETANTTTIIFDHLFEVFLMVLLFVFSFVAYRMKNLPEKIANLKSPYWLGFILVIILGILFFYDGNPVDFVYFQF